MKCKHLKSDHIEQKVDKLKDGYAIHGCCGGGCYTITKITHCPHCGKKILK